MHDKTQYLVHKQNLKRVETYVSCTY